MARRRMYGSATARISMRGQHARLHAGLLERVLERQRVDDAWPACPCSRRWRGPCPPALAATPRKMLPPPMTIGDLHAERRRPRAPRRRPASSTADRSRSPGSRPALLPKASGRCGGTPGAPSRHPPPRLARLADLEPGEALDDDPLARSCRVHLSTRSFTLVLPVRVLDERLLEQALLAEELLELALDDLVDAPGAASSGRPSARGRSRAPSRATSPGTSSRAT